MQQPGLGIVVVCVKQQTGKLQKHLKMNGQPSEYHKVRVENEKGGCFIKQIRNILPKGKNKEIAVPPI